MDRSVFHLPSERKSRSQFTGTIKVLCVYLLSKYKSHIESLSVLFINVQSPNIKQPKHPEETGTLNSEGKLTTTIL